MRLELACEEAETDEQWPYVGNKSNQRWLWYAVDHATNTVPAYVFGKRKGEVFKELKALLEPFGISRYYTDERHLESDKHQAGKCNTQKIERKKFEFQNLD